MRTRHLTIKEMANEFSKASRHNRALDLVPWSLISEAQDLLQALETQVLPAQEIADLWIAEQQKWNRRDCWFAGIRITLPKRRPRPIKVIDEPVR